MSVREFLDRPRELAAELRDMERRSAGMRYACTSVTAGWSGVRGGREDARECLMADLADLEREKEALCRELREAEGEVDRFLVRLRAQYGLRPYAILRWRCRLRRTWEEVRQGLEEIYGVDVSLRAAQNWYREAVKQAEELWKMVGQGQGPAPTKK